MEINATITLVLGVLFRIGVPVALTFFLVWLLHRLDTGWQTEAEKQLSYAPSQARNTGCWITNNCPKENLAKCKAYAQPDKPCWQVFRSSNGMLKDRCLLCKVFREAPLPIPVK